MRNLLLLAPALLLQACGAGLFHGERVTVDRDFIYLDDPVFLQRKSAYGERLPGYFAFQLPLFFNAGRSDTLRFAPGGATVASSAPDTLPAGTMPPGGTSGGPRRFACLVDTGETLKDTAALGERFRDTARILTLSPRHAGSTKVDVNFYCREYRPPWGRTDTLSLVFRKQHGRDAFQEAAISLPIHVSYRGPVVSILVGFGLLYAFTLAGWWIADP